MGQSISGGSDSDDKKGTVTELGSSKLVVTHVEVIRQREVIKVPEIVVEKRPTIEYTVRTEDTIRYEPRTEETVWYEETIVPTTRFVVKEEETTKYVPVEVRCEKPVVTDKIYERPVVVEKEYQLVTFKDLEAIKEALELVPKLLEEIKELRKYRIVEEVIKVPKINFIPTDVYKITQSGELVKDADKV